MRCVACNERLSNIEATNKSVETDQYFDLCFACMDDAGLVGTKNPRVKEKSGDEDEEYVD